MESFVILHGLGGRFSRSAASLNGFGKMKEKLPNYLSSVVLASLIISSYGLAAVIASLPLDSQIDIGLGPAITGHQAFGSENGIGFVQRNLTQGNGAGTMWYGPDINLTKAGYGPYVDLSKQGARIEFTARYFQGNGNSKPYDDAPIMVKIVDANGKTAWLGTAYGPKPNPTYPAWLTATKSVSGAPSNVDKSKIVTVGFYGADFFGTGNDFVQIRNLRLVDDTIQQLTPLHGVKNLPDGTVANVEGTVSAVFSSIGRFYLQAPDNYCGIQVRSDSPPTEGQRLQISGIVQTDAISNEIYLQALQMQAMGSGQVKPVFMNLRSLGGSDLFRQKGANGALGPNNVGLLVKIAGRLIAKAEDNSWIYVTDSIPANGNGEQGVKVSLGHIPYLQRPSLIQNHHVIITGISSLFVDDNNHKPLVLAKQGGYFDPLDDGNHPRTFRIMVVNFDPFCPGHGNKRVHEVFNWNNPNALMQGYITDLANTSGGWCNFVVTRWFDANYFPHFEDGFQYDPDQYVQAWRTQTGLHSGWANYMRILTDSTYPHNQPKTIAQRIADDEIDEVVLFAGPGIGFYEAASAGPNPFFLNGATYTLPEAKRNFAIMGLNYERGVDCMLESFMHRAESVMSKVYPSPDWWLPTYPPANNWEKFRMIDIRGAGNSAVGTVHYAPNSLTDYDWGNTRYVWSMCDDWLNNWPNLQGASTKRLVNCSEWGNGNMRLHHVWWLNHFPKAPGVNPDGRQNNWWKYVCDLNNYH